MKIQKILWAFSGLLMDGGGKMVPLAKICHTHPTMLKLAQLYLT